MGHRRWPNSTNSSSEWSSSPQQMHAFTLTADSCSPSASVVFSISNQPVSSPTLLASLSVTITHARAIELAAQRLFSSFRPVDGFSLVIVDLLGEILWREDIGVFGDLPASLIGAGWPRFRLLTQRRLLGNHREFRRDNLQSVWRLEFA